MHHLGRLSSSEAAALRGQRHQDRRAAQNSKQEKAKEELAAAQRAAEHTIVNTGLCTWRCEVCGRATRGRQLRM